MADEAPDTGAEPAPEDGSHEEPTGEAQAADNRENDPPA
jgi:hypothetical protein